MGKNDGQQMGRTIQSVEIAFDIIEFLKEEGNTGVTELADELGHSKSTIHSTSGRSRNGTYWYRKTAATVSV